MTQTDFKQVGAHRYACPGCGGALRYDIESRGLKCDSCGRLATIDELPDETPDQDDGMLDMVEYVCPSCGAGLHTTQTAATSFCSYCGSDVVLTQRLSRIRRPAEIQPFRVTRAQCEDIYRQRLRQARFAPDALLDQATIDRFRPIYIPYWRYTFYANGKTDGRGTRKYSDSSYKYEDYCGFDIDGEIRLSGILYDASSAFEDETAQKLRFRANDTVPFHPAYLSGMFAEAADTSDVVYQDMLKRTAMEEYNSAMEGKTGSTGSFPLPAEQSVTSKLVMMPVWLLASRQGERVLYTAVNGCTGEIVCDPPVSRKRFLLLAGALFCAALAALLLITQVVLLRPNLLLMLCCLLAALGMREIVPMADEILVHRIRDVDPTREMKLRSPESDRPIPENYEPGWYDGRDITKAVEVIRFFGPAILLLVVVFILIPYAYAAGASQLLALFISDRGVLAPLVLVLSAALLFNLRYNYPDTLQDMGRRNAGPLDVLLLSLLRALVIAGVVVTVVPVPAVGMWCYGLSIAILAALAGNMLRLNLLHNEFVTRPIPFFGLEDDT